MQTVLVTSSSRGMGRSVARQLATKGASVIIVVRDTMNLKEGTGISNAEVPSYKR